jgi:hypothetical protein
MNKKFVIATILIAFMAVAIYSSTMLQASEGSSNIAIHSSVCIYKNNELIGSCTHNTMMNAGLNWTRDLIGNAATSGSAKYIILGNGTGDTAATLTTLNGQINDCGLGPTQATTGPTYAVVGSSIGNFSTTALWTSTCNNEIVNVTALYNISAPGASCGATNCTMFASKNFTSSVTLQISDQLNVTWYVWVV